MRTIFSAVSTTEMQLYQETPEMLWGCWDQGTSLINTLWLWRHFSGCCGSRFHYVVPVSTTWSLVACSERVFKTPNEMHCINYLGGRKLRWYLVPIKCFYLEWPIICVIGWNMVYALKCSLVERSPGMAKPGAPWNRCLHPCSFIQTQEHPSLTSPSSVFIRTR